MATRKPRNYMKWLSCYYCHKMRIFISIEGTVKIRCVKCGSTKHQDSTV